MFNLSRGGGRVLNKIAGTLEDEVGGDPSGKGMCFAAYQSLPADQAESIEKRFVNYSLAGSLIIMGSKSMRSLLER